MTDSPTTEAAVVEEEPKETGKGLRTQLEKALARVKDLESDRLEAAIKGVGLSPEEGLGKAIAKDYSGELTVDAVAAYAETEYNHKRPEVQHPQAQTIVTEQARADQINEVTVPVTSSMTEAQAIAEAEAAGDFDRAGAIKAGQMQRLVDRNQLR